jgi:glutathione peroxidase
MAIYDIQVKTIDGKDQMLSDFRGKTLLVVNTASRCMFTNQYDGLEKLYEKFRDRGLVVLGFPCNQFGKQEPGDEAEVKSFCELSYQVKFPMYAKVDVNGNQAHALFQYLKKQEKGFLGTEAIKWNFTKFLIDKKGEVIKRFAPTTQPKDLEDQILKIL